jgi:hypothetical protein
VLTQIYSFPTSLSRLLKEYFAAAMRRNVSLTILA